MNQAIKLSPTERVAQENALHAIIKGKSHTKAEKAKAREQLAVLQAEAAREAATNAADRTAINSQRIANMTVGLIAGASQAGGIWSDVVKLYPCGISEETAKAVRESIKKEYTTHGMQAVTAKTLAKQETIRAELLERASAEMPAGADEAAQDAHLKDVLEASEQLAALPVITPNQKAASVAYDTMSKYIGTLRRYYDAERHIDATLSYAAAAKAVGNPPESDTFDKVCKDAERLGKRIAKLDSDTVVRLFDDEQSMLAAVTASVAAGMQEAYTEMDKELQEAADKLAKLKAECAKLEAKLAA